MVGLNTSCAIWQKLSNRVKKLKLQHKNLKKDKPISTYILEIKKIFDSLAAIGYPISDADHIEAIIDGLPTEYNVFVTSILSRIDPYSVEEIEALLCLTKRSEKHIHVESTIQLNSFTSSWNQYNRSNNSDRRRHSRDKLLLKEEIVFLIQETHPNNLPPLKITPGYAIKSVQSLVSPPSTGIGLIMNINLQFMSTTLRLLLTKLTSVIIFHTYLHHASKIVSPSVNTISSTCPVLDLWHARLGDASLPVVKRVLHTCNISYKPQSSSSLCNSCV
ncbi:uncharacterized protein HKW66_Vig0004560 [Vigna angularis]|uniref:GAG-pre-integrase domain-containing protein n=1 Tax=Phaseolus angularis TaxID=3914 RepID=A0A8T0LE57_PHAAN|nr:uncharacterized protein HKW66_Vig0004560 [Vigna angularis]